MGPFCSLDGLRRWRVAVDCKSIDLCGLAGSTPAPFTAQSRIHLQRAFCYLWVRRPGADSTLTPGFTLKGDNRMFQIEQGAILTATNKIFIDSCAECGILFGMPDQFNDKLRDNGKTFYCPNGHSLYYPGETDKAKITRLEREKQQAREIADRAKADAKVFQEQVLAERKAKLKARESKKRLMKRIENGVCPKCNRSFSNLKRHIDSKHKH